MLQHFGGWTHPATWLPLAMATVCRLLGADSSPRALLEMWGAVKAQPETDNDEELIAWLQHRST